MNENTVEKRVPVMYCNGIDISSSPYDFIVTINTNTPLVSEKLAEIVMSPEHAKVFSKMLEHNVKEYENVFGEIPDVHPKTLERLAQEGKINIEGTEK